MEVTVGVLAPDEGKLTLLALRPYLARYKRRLLLGFLFVVLGNALGLLNPWVLRLAIDDLGRGVAAGELVRYAAALVAIALAEGTAYFFMRNIINGVSRLIEYELRDDLFAHLQRLDVAYFQRIRTGDVVARATNDLNAVRTVVGPGLSNFFNTIVAFVATMALMYSIDLQLALYTSLLLPMISVVYIVFHQRIERRFQLVQEQFATLSSRAQENFSGVRVIKAYAREEEEIAEFGRLSDGYVARNLSLARLSEGLWPLTALVAGLATVMLLYLGGNAVIAGRLTLGQFVQFSAYLAMLTWPMIAIGWVFSLYQQGTASMKRIAEVFAARPAVADGPATRPIVEIAGTVELRDVSFCYPRPAGDGAAPGAPALQEVSLKVPAGTSLAIVGPIGSGKSTLAGLIPRLYEAPRGAVLVDGVDVRHIPLATLRGAVGYVAQETFLFSDTVGANVAFGQEGVTDAAVAAAVAMARLDKDLPDLPQGLETVIGERGVKLSGGQRQRAASARALVRNPRILILDDALSSVDTRTEEEIQRRLRPFLRRRTTIVVSHRISSILWADQIVVLDGGRIVERGDHHTLLARDGLYARMYRHQLLIQEFEAENDKANGEAEE